MLLKVDCRPIAVGKQPSIPLIYLGWKWTLNWWWWLVVKLWLQKHCSRTRQQTFRHDDCGNSGRCKSRADGVTSLVDVDVTVPTAPGFCWCEHATTSAHVAERTLTRSVGTSTADTWNTCDGTTCSPRLGWSLVTCARKQCHINDSWSWGNTLKSNVILCDLKWFYLNHLC